MAKGTVHAMDCAGELRRIIASRISLRFRLAIVTLAGFAVIPLLALLVWKPPILLVWNASSSAPVGLYRLDPATVLRRGDMVVARTPDRMRSLAAERHYLPANVPLVKRVAAAAGDRICAIGSAVSINGRQVAVRQRVDIAGRPMPWWSGCRRLRPGEFLLLMDSHYSFDGRYFGVTRSGEIMGRAELLWRRPATASSDG